MAARGLAAARRAAGQSVLVAVAAVSSFRIGGGTRSYSRSSTQPEEQSAADLDAPVTAAQVEAALNSKNVEEEVVVEDGRAATVLPDEVVDDADAAWVPDQATGVFVPAEEAAADDDAPHEQPEASPSVLDQTVFVREDMEDVERPAADMAEGDTE